MFSASGSVSLQTMIQQFDPSKTDIIQNLKDEKYALALRKACGVKLYPFIMTRLYEKFPPPNPRGADRGAHVRSSNL